MQTDQFSALMTNILGVYLGHSGLSVNDNPVSSASSHFY